MSQGCSVDRPAAPEYLLPGLEISGTGKAGTPCPSHCPGKSDRRPEYLGLLCQSTHPPRSASPGCRTDIQAKGLPFSPCGDPCQPCSGASPPTDTSLQVTRTPAGQPLPQLQPRHLPSSSQPPLVVQGCLTSFVLVCPPARFSKRWPTSKPILLFPRRGQSLPSPQVLSDPSVARVMLEEPRASKVRLHPSLTGSQVKGFPVDRTGCLGVVPDPAVTGNPPTRRDL